MRLQMLRLHGTAFPKVCSGVLPQRKPPFALLTPDPSSGSWRAVCCTLPAVGDRTPSPFRVEGLPELFEQLLIQLEDSSPPVHYRPQTDEPVFDTDQRMRIISVFRRGQNVVGVSGSAAYQRDWLNKHLANCNGFYCLVPRVAVVRALDTFVGQQGFVPDRSRQRASRSR